MLLKFTVSVHNILDIQLFPLLFAAQKSTKLDETCIKTIYKNHPPLAKPTNQMRSYLEAPNRHQS